MNYVRKLGFEETPDYDFLRELFTKVLRTLGEPDDGVFDWMLLNNGKGWEASNVKFLSFLLVILLTVIAAHSRIRRGYSAPRDKARARAWSTVKTGCRPKHAKSDGAQSRACSSQEQSPNWRSRAAKHSQRNCQCTTSGAG